MCVWGGGRGGGYSPAICSVYMEKQNCVRACACVCVRCCELQHRLPVREQMSQSSGTAATGDNHGGKNMSARWLFSLGLISRTQNTHTHARARPRALAHTGTLYSKEQPPSTSTPSQQAQIEGGRQWERWREEEKEQGLNQGTLMEKVQWILNKALAHVCCIIDLVIFFFFFCQS